MKQPSHCLKMSLLHTLEYIFPVLTFIHTWRALEQERDFRLTKNGCFYLCEKGFYLYKVISNIRYTKYNADALQQAAFFSC